MNSFLAQIRPALVSTLVLALVCCGLYPLAVWGLGQALFPDRANGSLLRDAGGAVRGSRLLGQAFTGDRYFHSRPSAAGNGYDATSSGGSNLGPTSSNLLATITGRVADYRTENQMATNAPVPADAVTASGSGLDPHISPANAEAQLARVARVRGLPVEQVRALVRVHTDPATFGLLGAPGVNVLALNLALDGPTTGK